MVVKSEVEAQFRRVAQEMGYTLAPLKDSLPLLESGLDSLSFAVIITRLEVRLGVDPFSDSENVVFPLTYGELVECYERATVQPQ
jgi:acyl carrier protein